MQKKYINDLLDDLNLLDEQAELADLSLTEKLARESAYNRLFDFIIIKSKE